MTGKTPQRTGAETETEKEFALTLALRDGFQFVVDFEDPRLPELLMDEPPPLGAGAGPNASRLLAAAVANCLSASLLFCLRKSRIDVRELRTKVKGSLVRDERGRWRIGGLRVRLEPGLSPEHEPRIARCRDLFEDFCLVTQSVRRGIDVQVEVAPASSV